MYACSCKVLVVGAGSGGCSLAAKLSNALGENAVMVLEPSNRHYYQPLFTLVGAGMKRLGDTCRSMASVMPEKVNWLQDKAKYFNPKYNEVTTETGHRIKYDILVLAMGLQLNYDDIPGLTDALAIPNGKVCSTYSPLYVNRVLACLRQIDHGEAIFTYPNSPVKCPGAPQKIAYIAEEYFRNYGKRSRINVCYNTSLPVLFGVEHYAKALWKVVKKRKIDVNLTRNLIEIQPDKDIAIFQDLNNPENICEQKYSMLHVVPPMSTPIELSNCKSLVNEAGFVCVHKYTLQHDNYDNVFAIGDCASTPNSKTAAAAAAQGPIVFNNILAVLKGENPKQCYDGYASCPLVTGFHTCIMAEFDYSLTPVETFPIEQDRERYTMFILKRDFLPPIYWHLMVKGKWNGPGFFRKLLAPLRVFKKTN